ncbi:MAG: hypothetical protein CMJ49_05015 [Planctomycetaceae bacterium]|nr:hypothetical protein [Planctomycetaceae bacterium]
MDSAARGRLWLCLAAGLMTVAGCAGRHPLADWSDRDLADRVRALDAGGGVDAAVDRGDDGTGDPAPAGAGQAWYVRAAMASNAEIRAARQRVERMRERVVGAGTLADPTATTRFGQLAETAAGQVDYMVGVQQSLPFPGTLDARSEVARQKVTEALYALEVTVADVEAAVRGAYWSMYAATHEAAVLGQNRELLLQIESSVRSRLRVGDAGQDDLLRVSRRLAALENQVAGLGQRQRTAGAMLNRLMSRGPGSTLPEPAVAGWEAAELDRDGLVGRAMRGNPQVRMAQARVGTAHRELKLARIEPLPDVVVGVQYGAVRASGLSPVADGTDQIAATVGVTIPLWTEKYAAAEREALRGTGEAIAQVRAVQDRAAFEVDDALARIESHQDVLARVQEKMMPESRQTIRLALTAYEADDVDLLQLLDDWQSLLDDQVHEARIVAALHRAMADLEKTLGGPVEATATDDPAMELR